MCICARYGSRAMDVTHGIEKSLGRAVTLEQVSSDFRLRMLGDVCWLMVLLHHSALQLRCNDATKKY